MLLHIATYLLLVLSVVSGTENRPVDSSEVVAGGSIVGAALGDNPFQYARSLLVSKKKKRKKKKPSPKPKKKPPSSGRRRPPPKLKKRPPPPRKKRPPPPRRRRPPPPEYSYGPDPPIPDFSPPPMSPSPVPVPTPSPPPPAPISTDPTLLTYSIVQEFPKDPLSFTQGLEYAGCSGSGCSPLLWESAGLFGQSNLRQVELTTGAVVRSKALPDEDFAEGITRWGDRILQLVFLSGKMFSYNVDNLDDVVTRTTPLTDGWGITNDGVSLIVSDGSSSLSFLDPTTLEIQRSIQVQDNNAPVNKLNELEWVDGLIYANIWQRDCIAQIDPATGRVVAWALMQGLKANVEASTPLGAPSPDVLNGMAWDNSGQRLFVTGKQWGKLFQVHLAPVNQASAPSGVPLILEAARQACIP